MTVIFRKGLFMDIQELTSIRGSVTPVIKYNPYQVGIKPNEDTMLKVWNLVSSKHLNLRGTTIFKDYVSKWSNDVLRARSTRIDSITEDVRYLADSLRKTLYFYNAAGISAPQIGVNKRIIVINSTSNFKNLSEKDTLVLINPEIISDYHQEELINGMEGCLSFPEIFVAVLRPKKITVRYQDLSGDELETEFFGDQAREILHEVEHLDGILIIDNVSGLKKNLILHKLKKMYSSGDVLNDVIALDALKKIEELSNE